MRNHHIKTKGKPLDIFPGGQKTEAEDRHLKWRAVITFSISQMNKIKEQMKGFYLVMVFIYFPDGPFLLDLSEKFILFGLFSTKT